MGKREQNMDELRAAMMDTLMRLRDKDNPMSAEQARAIADVGRVLVETVKVEVQYIAATDASLRSNFMKHERAASALIENLNQVPAHNPFGILKHSSGIIK